MTVLGDRVGSDRTERGRRLAAVAVPLIVCVVVLAWPGAAELVRAAALGGLGLGLLAVRWWL